MYKFIVASIFIIFIAGGVTLVYVSQTHGESQSHNQDSSTWCKNVATRNPQCQVFVSKSSAKDELLPAKEYQLGVRCLENNIFYVEDSVENIELHCKAQYPIKLEYYNRPEHSQVDSYHDNSIDAESYQREHVLTLNVNTARNWTGKYIIRSVESENLSSTIVFTHGGSLTEKHERAKRYSTWGNHYFSELQPMVELIVRRLLLADRVAINKWDNKRPVEDLPREKIILENVVREAQRFELSSRWASRFFTDQIEANKDIQNGLISIWKTAGQRPKGPSVDLANEIRPIIDVLNDELLKAAKKTIHFRGTYNCNAEVEKDARYIAFLYSLDTLHQNALLKAISNVCK